MGGCFSVSSQHESISVPKTDSKGTFLCVGSWNVHLWRTKIGKEHLQKSFEAIRPYSFDVLALQEYSSKVGSVNIYEQLCKCGLLTDPSDEETKQNIFGITGSSTFLATKFISHIKIDTDFKYSIFQWNDVIIGVFNVHFNYRDENVRSRQLEGKILPILRKQINQGLPILMLGDFNALQREDYDLKRWEAIVETRRENQWELPRTDLMKSLKAHGFHDVLYTFPNHEKMRKDTCRFETRIDYILVNLLFLEIFKPIRYEIKSHGSISDHKLVSCLFERIS